MDSLFVYVVNCQIFWNFKRELFWIQDELAGSVVSLRRCDMGWIWLPHFDWRQQIFTFSQNISSSIDRNRTLIFYMHFRKMTNVWWYIVTAIWISLKAVWKWIAKVEKPYHCLLNQKNFHPKNVHPKNSTLKVFTPYTPLSVKICFLLWKL